MSVPLLDRDPTPEDREAERAQPRPGVWAGEPGADLRKLTQDETDGVTRLEIWNMHSPGLEEQAHADLLSALGGQRALFAITPIGARRIGTTQRGGIDSDPLVRILARRAWGDRDRTWFELRGVRKGDSLSYAPLSISNTGPHGRHAVVATWSGDSSSARTSGTAKYDARPGDEVEIAGPADTYGDIFLKRRRVGDRLREPPARHGPSESSDEASFRVEFGFDHVWIDDDQLRMGTMVTVERGRLSAQRMVSDLQLREAWDPGEALTEVFRTLNRWLTEHGEPRRDGVHSVPCWTEPDLNGDSFPVGWPTGHAAVSSAIADWRAIHRPGITPRAVAMSAEVYERFHERRGAPAKADEDSPAAEPNRRGARDPGPGRSAPVPPWARERRKRGQRSPGR